MRKIWHMQREKWVLMLVIVLMFVAADLSFTIYGCGLPQSKGEIMAQFYDDDIGKIELLKITGIYGDNAELFGYMTIIFAMLILLLAWKRYQMERGTKEFLYTLPLKRNKLVLFDYFAVMSLIVTGFLFKGICLLILQSVYNNIIYKMAVDKGNIVVRVMDVISENRRLVREMLLYALVFLVIYTLLYIIFISVKGYLTAAIVELLVIVGAKHVLYVYFDVTDFLENGFASITGNTTETIKAVVLLLAVIFLLTGLLIIISKYSDAKIRKEAQ